MNQRRKTGFQVCLAALLASVTLGISFAGEERSFQQLVKVQATGAQVIEADVSDL